MTGNMFIRKTDTKINGKNAVIIVGVVGLTDEELKNYYDEHMYQLDCLHLINPVDLTDVARGCSTDNLLTSPIWRV